jgi:hypothetical protein
MLGILLFGLVTGLVRSDPAKSRRTYLAKALVYERHYKDLTALVVVKTIYCRIFLSRIVSKDLKWNRKRWQTFVFFLVPVIANS